MKTQILQLNQLIFLACLKAVRLRVTFIFLFLNLLSSGAFGQVKQWDKTIGGNDLDGLGDLQQTRDGGYILGGNSYSPISGDKTENPKGSSDYWIVKLDPEGNKLWDKTIGGSGYEELTSLHQTRDGGYILGGWSLSPKSGDKSEDPKGSYDYWVVKVDSAGNKQWDKTLGGNKVDFLFSIQQTTDEGYIVGGWSNSDSSGDKTQEPRGIIDFWVLKLDAAGEKQWDRTLGGNESDRLASLQQTSDGGYILGGSTLSEIGGDKIAPSKGSGDFWLVRLDSAGTKEWDIALGGDGGDALTSLQQTRDGGYILGGYSSSGISGDKTEASRELLDYWVVKVDAAGQKEWDKTLGGSLHDELHAIVQAADGGYLVGGYSLSGISGDKTEPTKADCCCFECPGDFWVVKLDSLGQKKWDKTLGGVADDNLTALQATSEGGFIVGGTSSTNTSEDKTEPSRGFSDFWVVKLRDEVQVPRPVFLTFSPQQGLPGSQVVLSGRFLTTTSEILFNGMPAEFLVLSDTAVTAKVPQTATSGPITLVTAGGRIASRLLFTVKVPRPVFLTFSPQQGLPGSQVTLFGRFLTTTRNILFNGVAAEFQVLSDTAVAATVPQTATSGPITLVTAGGRIVSILLFAVQVPPLLQSFSPQQGLPGRIVMISGKNLATTSSVAFNGAEAAFAVLSDSSLKAIVPPIATTGPITLIAAGGTATSASNFKVQQPRLIAFFPSEGKPGTKVIFFGERLQGTQAVRFNGVEAVHVKVHFDFLVTAVVPAGATTGPIRLELTGGGQVTSSSPFEVLGASTGLVSRQAQKKEMAPAASQGLAVALAPYPNPFSLGISIPLQLQVPATVQLSIYTQTGQLVDQITTGQLGAGLQHLQWDGRDSQGRPVASGLYFYRLLVNGTLRSGKLLKINADR